MPAPEQSHQYQPAVLWPFAGYDGYGNPKVGSPYEIRVRWNDVQSRVLAPDGTTISVDATAVVNRKILVGSRMWLGELDDLPGTAFLPESGWVEVKAYNESPDIRNRASNKTVGLMKFRDPVAGA